MQRASKNQNHARGAAVLLIATTLATILTLIGGALTWGYYWYVRTAVQAIVDAAALGAAATLGASHPNAAPSHSANQLWEDARSQAVTVINLHLSKSPSGLPAELSLDPSIEGTEWHADNFSVRIERGRWLPATNVRPGFESFEGEWQELHPGIPARVAGNAVQVTIRIPAVVPLIGWLPWLQFPIEESAVGLARPVNEVSIAPFAIPVCALLSGAGDLEPPKLCTADRLLTEVQRYCPPDEPDCDIVPSFAWDPSFDGNANRYWPIKIERNSPSPVRDNACFWPTPRFNEVGDNYGVIGLPGVTDVPPEI